MAAHEPDTTHMDGAGAIAIKMVHKDSTATIVADVVRLVFSICLLIFSTISVIYAIAMEYTTMPSFPPWAQYIFLAISLFILGTLEGLQIAVVELAHKDPEQYKRLYPRAAKLLAFENRGRNVERFLMGRQVLVVFTVFIAARITTFDGFWADVPEAFINSVMYSGFLGVILVVIVAQLTPQVLASAYPVEFLNLPGMKYAFYACIILETTGLVHAVWFLCVTVREAVYKCVCKQGEEEKRRLKSASMEMNGHAVVGHSIEVSTGMKDVAITAENNINAEVEMKTEVDAYRAEFVASDDVVDSHLNSLLTKVGNKRDVFYIYGDNKYMSPAQCYDKFKAAGLEVPQFLLPPEDDKHIPPHIVAMTLLKMYSAKLQEDAKSED